ncbi:MAG: tetratricopeptide repeat protein [Actinomycetota bacterium]
MLVPVAVVLFAVAAAGVVAPFRRRGLPMPEAPTDPLEERRLTLLLALRDLEEGRASELLQKQQYARLRADTERRAAKVLRALDQRASPTGPVPGDGGSAPAAPRTGVPRWLAALLVAATLLGVTAPTLLGSVEERGPGAMITGEFGREGPSDPLGFFEVRVRQHPRDVAARLDLAHRYLDAGRVNEAIDQYLAALRLDPDNAEAHAHLGLVLHLAGRSQEGLEEVERALATEPRYPEAMFLKGLILLQGFGRREAATEALETYLDLAPFGAERDEAVRLLRLAEKRGS